MSHPIYEKSLDELSALESAEITLPNFDSSIAWELGCFARQWAQEKPAAMVIDISLPNGQVLFHTTSKNGAVIDNDIWVARKKKTALRFGKSSFYMGRKVAQKKMSVEQCMFVDPKEYATHGGSVPIRVNGTDIVCGALTVSGLPQEEDHLFCLELLREMKKRLEEKM